MLIFATSFYQKVSIRCVHATRCQRYAEDFFLQPPDGLMAVFKPQNWTSVDVVNKVKYIITAELRQRAVPKGFPKAKFKIGHGGTLDPLAEGVLIIGVGKCTKLLKNYLKGSKIYEAVAALGSGTDTLDSTGTVTKEASFAHVTKDLVLQSLPAFTGNNSFLL
jgi:tRNA pseudouridine55 synthase